MMLPNSNAASCAPQSNFMEIFSFFFNFVKICIDNTQSFVRPAVHIPEFGTIELNLFICPISLNIEFPSSFE